MNNFELPEDLQYIVASYIPFKKIKGCKIKYKQFAGCEQGVHDWNKNCELCKNYANKTKIFITLEDGSIPVFKNYINNISNIINDKDYKINNNLGYWYNNNNNNNNNNNKLCDLFNSQDNKIQKIHEKKYVINNLKFALFISFFNELHPKKNYKLTHSQTIKSSSINILFYIEDTKIRNQLRCVNKIFNKFVPI